MKKLCSSLSWVVLFSGSFGWGATVPGKETVQFDESKSAYQFQLKISKNDVLEIMTDETYACTTQSCTSHTTTTCTDYPASTSCSQVCDSSTGACREECRTEPARRVCGDSVTQSCRPVASTCTRKVHSHDHYMESNETAKVDVTFKALGSAAVSAKPEEVEFVISNPNRAVGIELKSKNADRVYFVTENKIAKTAQTSQYDPHYRGSDSKRTDTLDTERVIEISYGSASELRDLLAKGTTVSKPQETSIFVDIPLLGAFRDLYKVLLSNQSRSHFLQKWGSRPWASHSAKTALKGAKGEVSADSEKIEVDVSHWDGQVSRFNRTHSALAPAYPVLNPDFKEPTAKSKRQKWKASKK